MSILSKVTSKPESRTCLGPSISMSIGAFMLVASLAVTVVTTGPGNAAAAETHTNPPAASLAEKPPVAAIAKEAANQFTPQPKGQPRVRWWDKLFGPAPIPIALTLCAALLTSLVSITSVVLTYRVGSRQANIAKSAVEIADKSASAALANAQATKQNADTAARAADNAGLHHVAKLRQEWINALRVDLSELQSLLRNAVAPAAQETEAQALVRKDRVRLIAAIMAKVRLSLNPREIPSQNLLMVLEALDDYGLSPEQRTLLSRWVLRWSQLVLKAEWDRVRHELGVKVKPPEHPRAPGKRDRFRRILLRALELRPRLRPVSSAPVTTSPATQPAKRARSESARGSI